MADKKEKGLPCSPDAERMVLGSILLEGGLYLEAASILSVEDLSTESHRRIFKRMAALQDRNEKIDRVTVCNELSRFGELDSVGGLSYLVTLDEGLPQIPHIESYCRIVKESSIKRTIIFTSQHMQNRAFAGEESSAEILAGARETFLNLGVSETGGPKTPEQIIEEFEGGVSSFLDPSKRKPGIFTGFAKFDSYTNGLQDGDLIILAARPSMGKTAMALNIAQHIAVKLQQPAVIFSLEMSKESLLTRMMCSAARVDSQRFRAGYLNADERRRLQYALGQLMEAPLHIDDDADTTNKRIQLRLWVIW